MVHNIEAARVHGDPSRFYLWTTNHFSCGILYPIRRHFPETEASATGRRLARDDFADNRKKF